MGLSFILAMEANLNSQGSSPKGGQRLSGQYHCPKLGSREGSIRNNTYLTILVLRFPEPARKECLTVEPQI